MDFVALVHECAPWASAQTMAAIVRRESGFKPLAIGINGGAKLQRQPASKDEAVATSNWLIANGYNIDLGLAQINSSNLAKLNLTVADAFDSCRNVAAAATLLSWNFRSAKAKFPGDQDALLAAISTYNTGSMTRGFANGYVHGVVANAGYALPKVAIPQVGNSNAAGKLATRGQTAKPVSSQLNVEPSTQYLKADGSMGSVKTYQLSFD